MAKIDYEKENKKRLIVNRLYEEPHISTSNEKQCYIVNISELLNVKQTMKFLTNINQIMDVKERNMAYQVIACSLIRCLGECGDIRPIRQMLKEFPPDLPIIAMQEFLIKYGHASFKLTQNGEHIIIFDKKKKPRLGDALATPWWLVKRR